MDQTTSRKINEHVNAIDKKFVGVSLYLSIPIVIAATVALSLWLERQIVSTTYSQYLTQLQAGIVILSTAVLLIIALSTVRPFKRLRADVVKMLADNAEDNDRYLYVLKGSGQGFWDYNVSTKQIFISGELMALLGYAPKDQLVPFSQWVEQAHPEDREGFERTLASHLDKRTPVYNIQYRIRRASSEYIWVESKGRAFVGSSGEFARVSGVTNDISNIKRVQTVLESRTSELEEAKTVIEAEIQNVKKFQKAVDASTEAVSITSPDGTIVYVNPAWVKLNGFTDTEAIGRNPRMLRSPKTDPKLYQAMWEKITSGFSYYTEDVYNQRKDGSDYQAALSIFPIREGEQTLFYVSTSQDITQRKEIDRAKTEFVSLASHQLRTPLSAIRWYSEMLMSKYVGVLNEKQQQYIKEIYAGNLRMVDLVNALLNVSRIDLGTFAIEPEEINLVEISDSVLSELTPQITAKRQTVNKVYIEAPTTYLGDPKLMRIIFQNFLSNSVKYTQEGGSIEVEIATRDSAVLIKVKDNGYGIPTSQHNKIFEKLFRADNVRQKDTEGTGLGMYIVKAIVESADGKIWFESEENKGSTFYVMLPLAGMPKKIGAKGLS